jgi:hypothetical protein
LASGNPEVENRPKLLIAGSDQYSKRSVKPPVVLDILRDRLLDGTIKAAAVP